MDVMKENGITVIFKENSPLYAVLPFDKFSEISDKADSAAKGRGIRSGGKTKSPQLKLTFQPGALFGAADEARTRYLHLGKVALYQMSYGRIKKSPKIVR